MGGKSVSQLDSYVARDFIRRTGCSPDAAYGYDCARFGLMSTVEKIMSAAKKPKGCSDVRWRIEMRRRAKQRELGMYYIGAKNK